MLVAIQRGITSTLMWSPLTFSMAITLPVVPGTSWAGPLPLCAAGALGLAGLGWAFDHLFKSRPGGKLSLASEPVANVGLLDLTQWTTCRAWDARARLLQRR